MRLAFSACHVCVQGKAAAADQRAPSLANLVVAKAAPQPMPESDSEAGIKAAIAEKVKQLQQMSHKDGVYEDDAYRFLFRKIAKLEGQVVTHLDGHAFGSCPPTFPASRLCLCVVVKHDGCQG